VLREAGRDDAVGADDLAGLRLLDREEARALAGDLDLERSQNSPRFTCVGPA
jgi:hypothetical protein